MNSFYMMELKLTSSILPPRVQTYVNNVAQPLNRRWNIYESHYAKYGICDKSRRFWVAFNFISLSSLVSV